MTKRTRERIESVEARLSALEDSLQAAEAQIEERKAENKYLNSLLVMLQSGVDARKGPTV